MSLSTMNAITIKEGLLFFTIVLFTLGLVGLSQFCSGVVLCTSLSEPINKQLIYQPITLVMTVCFLFILYQSKKEILYTYCKRGDTGAKINPEPYIGINPKEGENWSHIGKNFAFVISLVTAIAIYFQVIKNSNTAFINILTSLPFAILFALSNSFVEEVITRLGVVVVFKGILSDTMIPFVSALVFGSVHYFGNPGGIAGVLLAGFLGWLLCKSILETKGIYWAWLIHFLQDVIIFDALFALR